MLESVMTPLRRRRPDYLIGDPLLESVSTFGSRSKPVAGKAAVSKFNFFRVTDEQQALLRLRQKVRELESQNRELRKERDDAQDALNKRASFIANVSHEIRTPLSGVLGMAELLIDGDLNKADSDLANEIYGSAVNLLHIVNELLDYSKLEAGKVQLHSVPFTVSSILQSVCGSIAPVSSKKGVKLSLDLDTSIPAPLHGDRLRVQQVLLNLASNAAKFTGRGSITLRAHCIGETHESVDVLFAVIDTGIGIDNASQASLFEPFSQADSSMTSRFGGTGLGLSICKKLVDLMSGEIGFDSAPSVGSTFWFKIRFTK
jgi:two-component system sensor histidine kinase/response regulator